MRYAIIRIPDGTYREDDPALRWDGQRVRILGKFEPLTRGPNEREFVQVYSLSDGATLVPKDWLQQ